MALHKFLRPMPSFSVSSENKQMAAVDTPKKKRGSYSKISPEAKATIGRYASETELQRLYIVLKLKESTVRD